MESAQQPQGSATADKDTTASTASDAQNAHGSGADSARSRTGTLQAQLADALDSGANVLRQRAASLAPAESGTATAGDASGVVEQAIPRIAAQGELAATVMERGATWIRENDLSSLEGRVLGQLEQHPVRTLGIAAALGFLVAGRRR